MRRLWTKDYILGISINFLVMVNYYMLVVIMTDYALKFYDVSVTTAGLTAVIFIIGATLSRLICGAVMEKVGRTRMLMIFLLLNLFMSGLYFFVRHIVLLLAVRAVHGVSYGAVSTAVGTIAASVIPKSRSGEGIGYYMLSTTLAAAVGPFLGMTFHGNGSFSLLFAVCCALTGAATLAALFITRQPPSQPAAAPKTAAERGWKAFLEPKAFRVSGFAAAFYIGYSALLTYLAIYADEKGMAAAGRFFFVVYALSIFVSRPVTGPLFDKKGEAAVLLPAFLAFAAGMLLLGWCPDSPVLLVSAALLGFGVGVTQSTGLAAAVKEAPPQRLAVVNSTFYIFLDVAVGLGPVLMGFILSATGNSYPLLYTGLGFFSLAVTAVYFVFRPRRSF